MNPAAMDIDSPEYEGNSTGGVSTSHQRNVPFTPPQSTGNTPQRNPRSGQPGSSTLQRAGDSAAPESPVAQQHEQQVDGRRIEFEDVESDSDNDHSMYTTAVRRARGGGSFYPGEVDEGGRIEHEDFFNGFGNHWQNPQ
ncbi:hypothetical protein H4R20_006579 [Coemansia guatemalensis]|uniref:Uncharacterized protein n=1 Tax=Coemansia guatemalensis TaxID=2761395 RepID=A0A9W8HML1_9FUNG|nr:hypothetical protein H4R20_006579 [Coemansia guatemalensis]